MEGPKQVSPPDVKKTKEVSPAPFSVFSGEERVAR